ncbi:DUF3102 domain-containing protein [Mesorhizobium delmotii]|uniref:DUF3102 domain-containing protein n=1 Tax=Mesorhizobium delmotii TaxID=1631247 RepID=UPI001402E2B5|nr:DUF3102 domain-containing protein [Mesorhizobium delmotii]
MPVLIGEISAEHAAVMRASNDFVQHVVAAGHRLIEAKSRVAHGDWQNWLAEHLPDISVRSVQRYMMAARKLGKNDTVSFSTLREIIGHAEPEIDKNTWLTEMQRIWVLMGTAAQDRFRSMVKIIGSDDIPQYFLHLDDATLRKMVKAAAVVGGADARFS